MAYGTPAPGLEEEQLLDHLQAGHFDLLAAEGPRGGGYGRGHLSFHWPVLLLGKA